MYYNMCIICCLYIFNLDGVGAATDISKCSTQSCCVTRMLLFSMYMGWLVGRSPVIIDSWRRAPPVELTLEYGWVLTMGVCDDFTRGRHRRAYKGWHCEDIDSLEYSRVVTVDRVAVNHCLCLLFLVLYYILCY